MTRSSGVCALTVASLALAACSGTSSSSYRTSEAASGPFRGEVQVYGTFVPPEAEQLGIVEVDSIEELESAVREFRRRVAELGGDVGVIDRYSTSFEMHQETRTESYNCGTQQQPRTCTRTVTSQRKVATLHLRGRAMTTRRSH